ncbi:hypothetical protein [Bdellovibrio sp. HCB2-146]|uniref:hypothetical protein n=1 Tax=Bdellovibrio sp. HCB2-146 TaxID=3394362 RepID=UPI0039BD6A55
MKIVFIFLATLLSFSMVQAKTYCACQAGQYPESQVGFFKAGCAMWLAGQKDCAESITVLQAEGMSALPEKWNGNVVKLGYVGHWSSFETKRFLGSLFYDGVVARNMSFEVDNTACDGMKYPDEVAKDLRDFNYPQGKYIKFKANQVLSVGMWDPVLVGKSNLWAEADSRTSDIKYPRCEEFERQGCSSLGVNMQRDSRGSCFTAEGSVRQLRCCKMTIETTKLSAKKNSEPEKVKASSLFWATPEACDQGHF